MSINAYRRKALVLGVANSRSIAWSTAISLMNKGYDVIATYQNDRFKSTVEKMIHEQQQHETKLSHLDNDNHKMPSLTCFSCDLACEKSLDHLFNESIPSTLQDDDQPNPVHLDAVVHSVAYAPPDAMKNGTFLSTTASSFQISHHYSSYSLLSVAQRATPLLARSSHHPSITTLTYLGSTRAIPGYNIMGPAKASLEAIIRGLALELGPEGIRVNGVSAGPINTLAARGIGGFTTMRKDSERRSPLRRNVTSKEVADVVTFLAGSEASGITGQVVFVDGGYSAVGGPVL